MTDPQSTGLQPDEQAKPTKRPEWVRCVATGHVQDRLPWCGSSERPWFIDAGHAALNGRSGGRLVACPECVEAIYKALRNGHDEVVKDRP